MSEGNTTVLGSERFQPGPRAEFIRELRALLNRTCQENGSNTPDFMLASYLTECLTTWDKHVNWREQWYGRNNDGPAQPAPRSV